METSDYRLIDSGDGEKLEQFGPLRLVRPCAQAVWRRQKKWSRIDATFSREEELGWQIHTRLPKEWEMHIAGIKVRVAPTDFGHLGVFPDHLKMWEWMRHAIAGREVDFLNLFAYSGVATLVAAECGAKVCHLDASKGMVDWARDNARRNDLEGAPVRWIVDDAIKFLTREVRRGRHYDAILLDPPTYGRGNQGEIFKIETDLPHMLKLCKQLLSDNPFFIGLSCHTPGFTPIVLENLLLQEVGKGRLSSGEMVIEGGGPKLPCGTFARWMP